jgi:hypothetical protein
VARTASCRAGDEGASCTTRNLSNTSPLRSELGCKVLEVGLDQVIRGPSAARFTGWWILKSNQNTKPRDAKEEK